MKFSKMMSIQNDKKNIPMVAMSQLASTAYSCVKRKHQKHYPVFCCCA